MERPLTSLCGILNAGPAAWAFEAHAERLSRSIGSEIVTVPRRFNYVLACEESLDLPAGASFLPREAVDLAADKRLLAQRFREHHVPTPVTHLIDRADEVSRIIAAEPHREWCLKWPTGCGGAGHRLLEKGKPPPDDWPRPYVLQEFVRQAAPAVYRTYGIDSALHGWVVRRFPEGADWSPWVAHARGAHYVAAGDDPPAAAQRAARQALEAVGLWDSFGCVDLLLAGPDDRWLVLEVGTDGIWNHVDRELGLPALECRLEERLAEAFWAWVRRGDSRRTHCQ